MSKQEIIDRYFGKAISKTFTVFIIATVGLFSSKLTGSEWTIIAGVYGILVYPSVTVSAGTTTTGTTAQVSSVLPRYWRVVYTIGGTTPSFTLTNVQVNYLI